MEKTIKPVSKSASKVFDISKPGQSMATATSRPVIVSNRPIMQDPMMSKEDDNESVTVRTRTPEKIVMQPLIVDETEKDIKSVETESEPVAAAQEKPKEAEKSVDTSEETDDNKVEITEKVEATKPSDSGDETIPDGTPPLDGTNTPDSIETAKLEAAAKQMEEIDKLTEGREYFLPINTVEKRRSKIVTLLGLVLIILLGLLLVNLLLDVGIIHINGVRPVTHFFSS